MSAASGPRVSVAVVSFNTRELLARCLRSLSSYVEAGLAQVSVVDNASSDGSAQAARDQAPWAEVIDSPENLGFGRAVNLVARATDSEWLAIANADVTLEPGALEAMLRAGDDPRVGCVAPRLILPDGSTQSSLHSLSTVGFALAHALGLYRLSPRLADRLCIPGLYDVERPRDVPWAIGAFLLLRRRAFDAVGGFDERQWMYAEDLDLGWRLHAAGWITRYEPQARVQHVSGAATEVAFGPERLMRFTREQYLVSERRQGSARTRITAALNVGGAAARIAWMAPLALALRRWRAPLADNRRWLVAHLQGLRRPDDERMRPPDMRRFWNARAREDAFHFVDTRQTYGAPQPERFFESEQLVDYVLAGLGVSLDGVDTVLEIGCGLGRMTRVLAGRAASVVALDVSDEMLARARELNAGVSNVHWLLGDGVSLTGVEDESVDACFSTVVFQHIPDPAITLGYIREVGRVLRRGGWAALQISSNPAAHHSSDPGRGRLATLRTRGPRGLADPSWVGSAVEIAEVRDAAADGGLELDRVWGEGDTYCQVLLRKP